MRLYAVTSIVNLSVNLNTTDPRPNSNCCTSVDRVRIEKLSDTLYLARFDKWEKSGEISMRQDYCDSWFHGEIYNDPSTILVVQELLVLQQVR
jgi:hypothetical protein